MNSKKVSGEYSSIDVTSDRKGNKVQASASVGGYPKLGQLSRDMGDLTTDPVQNDEWEVIRKKKNKGPAVGGKQGSANSTHKTWVQPGAGRSSTTQANSSDSRMAIGSWNLKQQSGNRNCETASMTPQSSNIPPPLQHGWNWGARRGSATNAQKNGSVYSSSVVDPAHNQPECFLGDDVVDNDDDDGDPLEDESDDDFSDDYNSDASPKSHETRKSNKWFKGFFEILDKLTVDEMGEQTRQWHCPACHNGPGAIDWYDGLQPLMTHAKTKRSKRPRLHRELALLLDEELRLRGTSVIQAGEAFGKWKGLLESTTDREIVWPPMVIVMNTKLEKDENDKWTGMGNQELLEYFSSYAAKRARHSYGPQGHRGMSVLIFDPSVMGYMEAERLHKHFVQQETSREAWQRSNHVLFYHGGKRQLYGYLARKEDLDIFNQHSQGKSRLKFDMRSYQEMVVIPMKQMSEDNQQLTYLKKKVVKEKEVSKSLEGTVEIVSQKLRETREDNRIVRLRTKMQQEENQEMMNYQERFYNEQMEEIRKDIEEKERQYEKLLQEERAKAKSADSNSGYVRDCSLSKKIENFIESQTKDVEAFESRREQLIKEHDEKKMSLRRRHLAEEVELEKEFDAALTQLMDEYEPTSFQNSAID